MKRLTPVCALLALLAALPLVVIPAHAEDAIDLDAVEEPPPKGGPGVMVRPFEGPRAKTIHDRFVRALVKAGVNLVPAASAKTRLGNEPQAYVKVAQANGVEAFILGKIAMNKKSWTLTLEVRSGATGAVAGSEQISSGWLPGLFKAIDKDGKSKFDALVEAAKSGGSAPASADAGGSAQVDGAALAASGAGMDPVTDSEPSESAPAGLDATRPPAFSIYAGGGIVSRSFEYSDPVLDTKLQPLLPHSSVLLDVTVGATWYPAAHFGSGLLSHFGINGHFIRSLGGSTKVSPEQVPDIAPKEYPTIFQELDVGLRARVPMGSWEMGLNFGVGSQQMGLAGDNAVVRLPYATQDEPYPGVIPDIDSTYYRFGGDLVFPFLDWNWTLGAGMRLPNFSEKAGGLRHERWFPGANGTTATLSLGVNVPVYSDFGLLVMADFRQTGLDMNSSSKSIVVNSDTDKSQNRLTSSIAGGAVDRYIVVTAGITWGLGASKGTSAPTSEPEAEASEEEETDEDAAGDASDEGSDTPAPPPPSATPAPAAPPAPAKPADGDTSNPAFFGEASAGGGAKTPAPAPEPAKAPGNPADTSNPDFFK